ncbi:MAG: Sec-independent protein secretion pathway component TatC [Verrucomicrobiota bacterium]|jgi:sec-independent protein translocase protein TatC
MNWFLRKFFQFREKSQGDVVKPFLDHLEDLRWTAVKMGVSLVLGMVLAFFYVQDISAIVRRPLEELVGKDPLIVLGVTDAFMISLQLAFYSGLVLSFPLLVYFLAEFVLPALTTKERRILMPSISVGFVLFAAGAVASYYLVLPMTLKWFRDYAQSMGLDPRWQARDYFGFVTHLTIACGLLCELPVGVLGLAALRLVTFPLLSKTRPYAIVAILMLVAVISPTPDPFTFLALAAPVVAIYEGCIWLVWLMDRRRAREEAGEIRALD